MGLEEQLLEMARKEGREEGLEKSLQVANLLQNSEFNTHQIAEMAGVSAEYVERVKKTIFGNR